MFSLLVLVLACQEGESSELVYHWTVPDRANEIRARGFEIPDDPVTVSYFGRAIYFCRRLGTWHSWVRLFHKGTPMLVAARIASDARVRRFDNPEHVEEFLRWVRTRDPRAFDGDPATLAKVWVGKHLFEWPLRLDSFGRGTRPARPDWPWARMLDGYAESHRVDVLEPDDKNILVRNLRVLGPFADKTEVEVELNRQLARAAPDSLEAALLRQELELLSEAETTVVRPKPVQDRARGGFGQVVRREVAGGLHFAAAYLVKEAMKGRGATADLARSEFWLSLAVFTATARVAEALPLGKGLICQAVPLAAGMAAVQVLRGEVGAKSLLLSTGAYLSTGMVVHSAADALLYPLLFRTGPPGWFTASVYTVGKLAASLYAGEKFEEWLNKVFSPSSPPKELPEHRGVADPIERLGEPSG